MRNYLTYLMIILLVTFFSCRQNKYFNNVIKGKKEGKFITYDKNGQLESILSFKNNQLEGECVWFSDSGKIRSKVLYHKDKENGLAYYFYPSGTIMCFRYWQEGKKVGYANDYYDTIGELKSVLFYNDSGYLILRNTYNISGKLIKKEGKLPN